jgi:hypothetical protein
MLKAYSQNYSPSSMSFVFVSRIEIVLCAVPCNEHSYDCVDGLREVINHSPDDFTKQNTYYVDNNQKPTIRVNPMLRQRLSYSQKSQLVIRSVDYLINQAQPAMKPENWQGLYAGI